jgi:hypothetical protein
MTTTRAATEDKVYKSRRVLGFLLFCLALGIGCSRDGEASANSNQAPAKSKDPYLGAWISLKDSSIGLSIQPESDAYVIEDAQGNKYVGTKASGVLRMSSALGAVDILYIKSSDHLVAAGSEYKRFDPRVNFPMRAMADIRAIATATESYATDHGSSGCAGFPPGTFAELAGHLTPNYIKRLPLQDPWGHPYYYRSDGCHNYVLVSAGGDGKLPADLGTSEIYEPSTRMSDDLVYANGRFVRLPPGWTPTGRNGQ